MEPASGVAMPTLAPPAPAAIDAADPGRLVALRDALHDLAAARETRALPPIALHAAIAVTRASGGSFWRAVDAGWECHLAEGPDAAALSGRVLSADEVLAPDPTGAPLLGPIAASPGARPFAALRVRRDPGAERPFGDADRALLEAVAAATATAFVFDARLRRADRGADLALLAEMSREIASTLDLDRVLRLAVNLTARAVTFDRGVLALYEKGECDVRAVAGTEAVDANVD